MNTIEDFYNEFESNEIKIIVFVSTGFGGAMPAAGHWQITSFFPVMIDLNTNQLIEADGRIEQVVTGDAYKRKQYSCFKDNGIYRLVVSKCIPKELSPNVLPVINNRYLLKRVVSSYEYTNEPQELVDYRKKYLEPVYIRVEDTDLLLNRRFNWYEGAFVYGGYACEVILKTDPDSNKTAENASSSYASIKRELDQWVLKAKEKATEELLSVAMECLEDDSELSPEEFKNKMDPLESILIKNNGSFEMSFGDSDLFGGHQIMLRGSLEAGFKGADIVG